MSPDFYNTIELPSVAEYKDKGSKFIAYAFPVATKDECKEKLAIVQKDHPKASHHCFAWRIGLDGNEYRINDDGEPAGTGGRPILGQIDSKQVTNTMVIVVRYFGGSLLGVPGLINAYKTAASAALQLTPAIKKPVLHHFRVQFDYMQMNDIMRLVKQLDVMIVKQETQLSCLLEIAVAQARLQEYMMRIKELKGVENAQIN